MVYVIHEGDECRYGLNIGRLPPGRGVELILLLPTLRPLFVYRVRLRIRPRHLGPWRFTAVRVCLARVH